MALTKGGNKKIWFLLALLVILLGLTGASLIYTAIQTRRNQQYLPMVSGLGLLSQQMATAALKTSGGEVSGFQQLEADKIHFHILLNSLQNGKPDSNLPPLPADLRDNLQALNVQWIPVAKQIGKVVAAQKAVADIARYAKLINRFMPQLTTLSAQVTERLIAAGASSREIYLAGRQSLLIQRIENDLARLLGEQVGASDATKQFKANADLFGQVLQGMLTGNAQLKVSSVRDPQARILLKNIAMIFIAVSDHVAAIMQQVPQFIVVKELAGQMQAGLPGLFAAATRLEGSIVAHNARFERINLAGYVFGGVSIGVLLLLAWVPYSDKRRELAVTEEQGRRNQRAILRLLDEMTNLAEGDLSTHATVTEDITGALADSVNYAIDALRSLVTTINQTSVQVATAVRKTQATTLHLSEASNHQAREISSTSHAAKAMSDSINHVAEDAEEATDTARNSVVIAAKGSETVSRSIDGMDTIREQIQDTSKRIKRLGESSQEIGDIVGLISDIADQTNILALNAAIQASAAGEAGRGFAVVADEVQRLAERSVHATRQIEILVKTIQVDAQEAILSMEQSTTNVVAGEKLAGDAGSALAEIEQVSNQLAKRILAIADAARQQAAVAANVMQSMTIIQEITMQTSEGTNETAESIGQLAELAAELRKSVTGFKLPNSGG